MTKHVPSILFISPVVKKNEKTPPHFPLGIAYLAAFIKSKGFKVAAIDLNIDKNEENLLKIAKKYDFIGISVFATAQINHGYYIAQKIKTNFPNKKIIYGGYHTNSLPEEAFKIGYADYIINGHGEIPLYRLMKGEKFNKIPGLNYFENGKFYSNPNNLPLDLNSLPFPAVDMFKIKKYQDDVHVLPYARHTAIDVKTSMGCPNFCTYCSAPLIYHGNVYTKSPDYTIKELKHYIKNLGINFFHFEDENCLVNRDKTIELCNKIIKEKLKIKYALMSSINVMYNNLDLVPLLSKSGCVCIDLGMETASVKVRKIINKSNNLNELLVVDRVLKENNIFPFILIMTFNDGETLDSLAETTNFMLKLAPTKIKTIEYLRTNSSPYGFGQFATPHVGTVFFKNANETGLFISQNNYDYHTWTKPSYIPNTFLEDIPFIFKKTSKKLFLTTLKSKEEEIKRYFNQYVNIFWNVYSKINNLDTIINIYKKYFSRFELAEICLVFGMLAKLNLICSKKLKK